MKYYVSDNLTTLLVNIEKLHYDKVEELRKEIKELKAETTQSKFFLKGEQVNTDALCNEINESREHYEEEIAELKAENELRQDQLKACVNDYEELEAENKRLKDKLQAVNDDYNNDHKVHNDYEDGLLDEVKELKADKEELRADNIELVKENEELKEECKEADEMVDKLQTKLNNSTSHYPKEYKKEADEYFHHVPEAKEVYFFMLSEWEMKDAERGDLCIDKDNAICVINNAERGN